MNKKNQIRKIIWAEDNDNIFKCVSSILKKYLSREGISIEIVRARDGNEVFRLLGEIKFDLLVTDLQMEHFNGLETVKEVVKRRPGITQIVVSRYVSEFSYQEELQNLKEQGIIQGCFRTFGEEEKWCQTIAKYMEHIPLCVIHLADIHFGKYHAFTEKLEIRDILKNHFKNEILDHNPNLVIISGDLTSEALDKEFDSAHNFIQFIANELNLSLGNFIIVPGNHDILRAQEEPRRFERYIEFLNECFGNRAEGKYVLRGYLHLFSQEKGSIEWNRKIHSNEHLYTIRIFDAMKTIVVGINSVVTKDKNFNKGEIPLRQLTKVEETFNAYGQKVSEYFKIAVFHHHLFPTPSIDPNWEDRVLSNQGIVVRHLMKMGFRLVLHGHTHYPVGYQFKPYFLNETSIIQPLYVFSTGTLGGENRHKAIPSFHFNMLKFEVDHSTGKYQHLNVFHFTHELDKIGWDSKAPIKIKL
jgi:3',5'-cyclic AMP phosphodiesterase CpdA/CheY-like chemotaxis protein